MLLARIGDDVHQVAAVAQLAQFIQSQKGGAGKVGFHAEHTIELDRMSDGFVNLQSQAARFPE